MRNVLAWRLIVKNCSSIVSAILTGRPASIDSAIASASILT